MTETPVIDLGFRSPHRNEVSCTCSVLWLHPTKMLDMSRRANMLPTWFSSIQAAALLESDRGRLLAECAAALYWAAFTDR
jgi:hypothetical protein